MRRDLVFATFRRVATSNLRVQLPDCVALAFPVAVLRTGIKQSPAGYGSGAPGRGF